MAFGSVFCNETMNLVAHVELFKNHTSSLTALFELSVLLLEVKMKTKDAVGMWFKQLFPRSRINLCAQLTVVLHVLEITRTCLNLVLHSC